MKRNTQSLAGRTLSLFGCLGLGLVGSLSVSSAATFDEQRKIVAASPATQSEVIIISLLKAGIEEGKPMQAIAEARKWLRQNLPEDAMLLFYAGRAAELSGDAGEAAALYQQFLKKVDPKSESASQAIIAVHSLLRDQLNDVSAAYSFNRNVGDRLVANPTTRQFDQWFLDESVRRGDAVAVAKRLHAVLEAGIPGELRAVYYDRYFRWLLEVVNINVEQPKGVVSNEELVSAYKQLVGVMSFNEELALRLDWAVSVLAYNQAKIAEQVVVPPIAEAKALLTKFPRFAQWVQTGWAGGGNGQHYRNDPAKYWPHEIDAKMEPVVAAASKLSPLQLADLFRSWNDGFYSDRVVRPLAVKSVSDYLVGNPRLANSRTGVLLLEKPWNKLTSAEAIALAPLCAANAKPEASLVRAVAAGGEAKDLNKMIAALIGPEAWRLGATELDGRYADQLWHYAGRPGDSANRDQKIKESKALSDQIKSAALKNDAPSAQRVGLFKKLLADYRSATPKTPGLVAQLKAVLLITPEAIPELLNDQTPEAQLLARDAIAGGVSGSDPIWKEIEAANKVSVSNYAPGIVYLAQRHAGGRLAELKQRQPQKFQPHPLEPVLRKSVEAGLKQNTLEPWKVIAWINMQCPEGNEEQVKLMQALFKSPLWKTMPFEVQYGARQWFGKDAMTEGEATWVDAGDPSLVCRDLLALVPEEEEVDETGKKKKKKEEKETAELDEAAKAALAAKDVEAAVAALQSTLSGVAKSPVRIEIPARALENLATLSPAVFADAKAQALMLELIDSLKLAKPSVNFGNRLLAEVAGNPDPLVLHRVASFLWEHVNRNVRSFEQVKALTQAVVDDYPSAASALASAGLDAIARHRGHSYFKREVDLPLLKSIRGNAAMKMGLIVIPVPKSDPSYSVYVSQGDWITGNEDNAWDLLDENWESFLPVHRELSMPFLKWVLQRVIYSRDEARQEELIKALIGWAGEAGSPLSPEEKLEIDMAYGDIAMQRGQLRQAHEIFSRAQKNEAYQESPMRHQATLRKADAERLAKNFDGALQTLNELELERIPEIWTEIRYARALVFFDMEEFDDAKDDIDTILARESNHADAKILLGKVQLKRQKLMEATEVELGSSSSQRSLVPGENLKVTLTDPTLAVSGAGTEIEVVVWATSGDKETFFLRQFGDQKTKFRGEVPTALGAPEAGDDILQVIGDDEVYYAYSERFREKMNGLEEKRGGPIIIASDAVLMASARKLLTEAEQRTADMAALMDEVGKSGDSSAKGAARAKMAARALDAEVRAEDQGFSDAEFARFITNVAKPGNPIYVRVIDPDRSRTPEIDELSVAVSSSSGDSIGRITLKETDTHSGWFEGRIPTTGAQALAFARNSEPGRNPNMVISPAADTYPAWRPVPSKNVTPEFKVDLNDNVELGELTITATEDGAKLKTFALETGMNEGSMTTVAAYPKHQASIEKPWEPSVLVMNDTDKFHTNGNPAKGGRVIHEALSELVSHVERGWMTQEHAQGFATNVGGISEALPAEVIEEVKWKRQGRHDVSSVIYRFRGYFHEEKKVTRRFRLDLGNFATPKDAHPSVNHKPSFLLVVDGRRITGEDGQLDGTINLNPGVHRFEIWGTGWVNNMGFGARSVKLQSNLEAEDELVEVAEDFFDPSTFPEDSLDPRNAPATVTANEDGTEFKIKFAPGSRSRLLKLAILEHEGPAPALNKLEMSGPTGEKILPVAEDFAALNKNDTLEILTGDKIFVRYVDDRFVTDSKERLERSLDVSFTDARAEFADMEPRWSSGHNKDMPYYEKLLRFPYDEPLSLAIHDADMDVSVDPDRVNVTLTSETGGERVFEAVETGDSTGIFKLVVTPVGGAPSGEDQFRVANGGRIVATYLDEENNRPGVPVERVATIDHAAFVMPELVLSHPTVTPFDGETMRTLIHGFDRQDFRDEDRPRLASERVRQRWLIENSMLPASKTPEGGFKAVHGRPLYVDLIAPQLALGTASNVTVYAQTDAGRKIGGEATDGPAFDISVPGTVALNGRLTTLPSHHQAWRMVPELAIYTGGDVSSSDNPNMDRFKMSVPLIAGPLSPYGALSAEERKELVEKAKTSRSAADFLDRERRITGLVVKPGEKVHFGFRYKDEAGEEQWLTASTKVITHPTFDLMSEDYRSPVASAYVGETLNLRVVDLGADLSDLSDTVEVLVQAKSGAKHRVELRESGPHTGIFKASYALSYVEAKTEPKEPADGKEATEPPYDPRRDGFPVTYGDTVAARYTDANGIKTDTLMVTISKGADGSIEPFSKTYEDEEIAMRTQFSLAESYLEMAKRHRKLDQPEKAEIEYASAKQLLSKAMDQFTDPETRAHAEYLLGNLTMEEADATEEGDLKETRYRAALSRFLNVTGSYSQTLHASKAQYRIATLYERLKEPDIAAQEYVKLAYKYPDSEFLPTSMARLGSHFLKKAAAYEAQSKPLLAKEDDKDAQFEGEALRRMGIREYIKTAQIFGRLQERFPGNELAGQAGLRAGQAYMRAEKRQEAVESFQRVVVEQGYDGPNVRAQAMYWTGMCYQDLRQQMAAYSTFKRLTYDFPESKWAAYARGQLSQERMLKLETDLELERLEAGQ